jgi:hypothetical protein
MQCLSTKHPVLYCSKFLDKCKVKPDKVMNYRFEY